MKHTLVSAISLASLVLFTACKDDDDTQKPAPANKAGMVTLELAHWSGNEPLEYNTKTYFTPINQEYTISDFKYYLSNFKLHSADHTFSENESYHLVRHESQSSRNIKLDSIQDGLYTSISFAIGVDSVRNHSGAQTGALDPANGMFWSWNSGYKFFQLEGSSQSSPQPTNTWLYHIGLDQNYRVITLPLSPAIQVREGSMHLVTLKADVNKVFGTPDSPVDITEIYKVEGVTHSGLLADNYSKMFSLENIAEIME